VGPQKRLRDELRQIVLRDHLAVNRNVHLVPENDIAGPPAMFAGLRKMLVAANIDEDDIRTEDFAGY